MSLSHSWNQSKFDAAIADVVKATGRAAGDVVKQEAKLFVADVVKMTPPFGTGPTNEPYNKQRKIGEAAVERQITRLFPIVDPEKVRDRRIRKDLEQALRKRDYQRVKTLLRYIGRRNVQEVLAEATPEIHQKHRDRRGRIQQRRSPYAVVREASVKRVVRMRKSHVGKAKAGWLKAANALGVKLPGWITRHSGAPGQVIDKTNDPKSPSITVSNLVQHAQESGQNLQIVNRALKNRERNIRVKLERIARSGWKPK